MLGKSEYSAAVRRVWVGHALFGALIAMSLIATGAARADEGAIASIDPHARAIYESDESVGLTPSRDSEEPPIAREDRAGTTPARGVLVFFVVTAAVMTLVVVIGSTSTAVVRRRRRSERGDPLGSRNGTTSLVAGLGGRSRDGEG